MSASYPRSCCAYTCNPRTAPAMRCPVRSGDPNRKRRRETSMFVFKAAVVGAGTMGGQIAQTIAAAGIPVVLKDIDDALVQAGPREARNVTSGHVGKLVEKGRLTPEQGEAQIAEIVGRIEGTTSYAAFGDVDFVVEAVPERMEIKHAAFAQAAACT